MPQNDPVTAAKAALSGAEKKFPGSMAQAIGVTPAGARAKATTPTAVAAKPAKTPGEDTAAGLAAKSANVKEYMQNVPKMHKGGKVPGKPGEEVPIIAEAGETVIPADKSKGRQSEYRKVFVARRQSRQGGGNVPATGEKHDSKKAEKGIAEKKA